MVSRLRRLRNRTATRGPANKENAVMLGVLLSQGEVLVLLIVTAVVVFVVARSTRKRR